MAMASFAIRKATALLSKNLYTSSYVLSCPLCRYIGRIPYELAGNVNSSWASLPMGHIWASSVRTFSSKRGPPTRRPAVTASGYSSTMTKHLLRKPIKKLVFGKMKTAGRNNSGRITSFHRGGGAKRLHRTIDMKRSPSAVGIVERVEYDPNRSSRIALVRWIEGVKPPRKKIPTNVHDFAPPAKIVQPATVTTTRSQFSFASLPGKVYQIRETFSPYIPKEKYAVIGRPTELGCGSKSPIFTKGGGYKIKSVRDAILAAFSSPEAGGGRSVGFPRVMVAGAQPAFYGVRMRGNMESPCEVRKWKLPSRMTKSELCWVNSRGKETLGLPGEAEAGKTV